MDRTVVTKHIKNIYSELELNENSTSANYALVQKEGNREITRNILYYNLDMVISVGYRTNSDRAIQFRGLATHILKDAGKISHEIACDKALTEFEKYRVKQDRLYKSDFDLLLDETEDYVGDEINEN